MSATTFAGSAQVAVVSILGAGGGTVAAIAAALLLNARYAAIGVSVGAHFRGSPLRRVLESQLIVDESWALTVQPDGSVDRAALVGAGGSLWLCWVGGTIVGAFASVGDPTRLGLDGAFPALFLALALPMDYAAGTCTSRCSCRSSARASRALQPCWERRSRSC